MAQYEIQVADALGRMIPLRLALNDQGQPMFGSRVLDPIQQAVVVGEASYANFLPRVSGVYAQPDLSGGLGKKSQAPRDSDDFTKYYYAEYLDASVAGQIQKGAQTNTLTPPSNSGTLRGHWVLDDELYLNLGRIIAKWSPSADTLSEADDLGSGGVYAGATVFYRLADEASTEASTDTGAADTIDGADDRLGQSFRMSESGVRFISKVTVELTRTGDVTGDVRLAIHADYNGEPGDSLASARQLAANVGTSAGTVTFKFDDADVVPIEQDTPYWLVLDAAGATSSLTIDWTRSTTDAYARGRRSVSSDGGNAWSTSDVVDLVFDVFTKQAVARAFVGADDGTNNFATTTDGATFTADDYRKSTLFEVVGDAVVRDIRNAGAVQLSIDGRNWSEPIILGDPTKTLTALVRTSDIIIACKTDSIWAIDVLAVPVTIQQLWGGNTVADNGVGATAWKGGAYIPFDGRLMAILGSFASGFDVFTSIGPESLPEWDFPWGAGRVVAVAGDRHMLYAALSATGGYRLLKSARPTEQQWHGSIARLGNGTQTVRHLAIYDAGGTTNPELFYTTTGDDVGRSRLSRYFNPASDPNYRYDVDNVGVLHYSQAHMNFHVHPKGWLSEAMTFLQAPAGDYAEMLYDVFDGDGPRRIRDEHGEDDSRLYDTGILQYPSKLSSRLMARQLHLVNHANTSCPILLSSGVTSAVRPAQGALREITFSVDAEDGLSANALGDTLGVSGQTIDDVLEQAATGEGTRGMVDHRGRYYPKMLFLSADSVLVQADSHMRGRRLIQVNAVQVAPSARRAA